MNKKTKDKGKALHMNDNTVGDNEDSNKVEKVKKKDGNKEEHEGGSFRINKNTVD